MLAMFVIGHGIDLVDTARIAEMGQRYGERFLLRVFTDSERAYAAASPRRLYERLAVRFAAKESVLKALGTGWRTGIAWRDVEVLREPSGQPRVHLTGGALAVAQTLGITTWHISLSHTETHAIASAIALGDEPPPTH